MANSGAVASPIFQPAVRVITNITKAGRAEVTTSFAHNFLDTDIVRIFIPAGFGMQQINGLITPIIVTSATSFSTDIDTNNFDPFSDPNNGQNAQVVPVAENNSTIYGATFNTLPSRQRNFVA